MIAGALNPSQFDRISCTNALRFAATSSGWIVAARAISNTPATVRACSAATAACAHAALKNSAYGVAAAIIAADAAPLHQLPDNAVVTDEKEAAAVPSSAARPSQAVAAFSIGAGPAPLNISRELISGGKVTKFATLDPLSGRTAEQRNARYADAGVNNLVFTNPPTPSRRRGSR